MKQAGAAAQTFCRKPAASIWATLIFGEDEGVVSDLARTLESSWAKQGEFERQRLDEDAVRRDPAALYDALEAQSLLGGASIVRVATSGDKLNAVLKPLLDDGENRDDRFAGRLIVTAGVLASRSKLRSAFESATRAAALQVFADTADDLQAMARIALSADKVDIEPDALDAFLADLPGHRSLANSELEKLRLFGQGLERPISKADIAELGAAEGDAALSQLSALALDGEAVLVFQTFEKLMVEGISPISLLRALQRDVERLLDAHAAGVSNSNDAVRLRPPVYARAWPAFQRRLNTWSSRKLLRALERIHDAERQIKTSGAAAGPALLRMLANDFARVAQ